MVTSTDTIVDSTPIILTGC